MSAIAVILHTDGRPASASAIAAMTSVMQYRGRDGIRHVVSGNCALGHAAFHCCAEDREALQPLADADSRLHIIFDGYLANPAEIRRDLAGRGVALRNRSDAELCLQAYALWGEDCLDHLDGEFAFCIFDAVAQELFGACDHTGLRQLHYHWDGRTLVAATDIAGVLAGLGETPEPNLPYLAEHVADGWFTQDETAWKGVMRLPKAHCLLVSHAGLQRREYWRLPTEVTLRYASDGEYAEQYRSVLGESVAASARTDAPLACEVSGGLDSSAIFCLLDRMDKAGELAAPGLHGFTLAAPPGTPADEVEFVAAVERQTGRTIAPAALFCPDLDWFVQQGQADRRLAFPPNTVMLREMGREMARSGCRVSLTGQGGDQWLDGLPHYYRQALQMGEWRSLLRSLRADSKAMGARWTIAQAARQSMVACLPDRLHKRLRAWREASEPIGAGVHLLSPAMQRELARRRQRYANRLAGASADDQIKLGKLENPFALLAADMGNLQAAQVGVETRHPMLSRKFVTFSAATPEHIRRRGGVYKFIHREAMRGILPNEIVERDSKAHFSQTFAPLLKAMEQFCHGHRQDGLFERIVNTGELLSEYGEVPRRRIDEIPIWTLWGTFAVAAFLDASVAASKREGSANA